MDFKFKLSGKKFFIFYFLFLLFYAGPMVRLQFLNRQIAANTYNVEELKFFFLYFFISIISLLIITMPITRIIVNNIYYKDKPFRFTGTILKYVSLYVLYIFLTIITIGIYAPWFVKNIENYIMKNIYYDDTPFSFKGKGLHLLGILFISIILPMLILFFISFKYIQLNQDNFLHNMSFTILMYILMIPYLYLVCKWMVNFSYKNFTIKWETNFFESIPIIFIEIVLSVITIGIYSPIAYAKLYSYFADRTVIYDGSTKKYSFKYNFSSKEMFYFTWKQIILTIVTFGIYGSWAYCKMIEIYVDNTTLEEIV